MTRFIQAELLKGKRSFGRNVTFADGRRFDLY